MTDPGHWLRPLTPVEQFFESGHHHGTFLVCYHLIVNTREPLERNHVQLALIHLCRKVVTLRLCIQMRDGVQWFREAENPQLDFQEIGGGDVQSVIEGLRQYVYDVTTGPLWCCRLLYDVVTDASDMDIQKGFEHMSHIFLGFHHGLQDGASNVKICGWFTKILNDVIAGVPITDNLQLGYFASIEHTTKVVQEKRKLLDDDPELRNSLIIEGAAKKSGLSLLRMINPTSLGSEKNGKSLHLKHILDKATTSRFLQKCRAERVTIHAAFTALANVALIDVLKEKGIVLDQYIMTSSHVVNNRRYWVDAAPDSLGSHVCFPLLDLQSPTPQNASQKFWDYARSVHAELKQALNSGKPMLQEALNNPRANEDFSDYFDMPQTGLSNYSTSNIGEVTSMIPQDGSHARLTYFYRTISVNHTCNTLSHIIHTYRGYFIYVMDYNTGTVPTQTAERFCQKIFSHLEKNLDCKKRNVPTKLSVKVNNHIIKDVEEVV